MPHDRVEMKSQHPEFPDGAPGLTDGSLSLERIDCAPGMNDAIRVALLHRRNEIVRTRRRSDGRFEIQRHQNGLDASVGELPDHRLFGLRRPRSVPVFGQCVDVRLLAGDPLPRVGVTMKINDPHVSPFRPGRPLKLCQMSTTENREEFRDAPEF